MSILRRIPVMSGGKNGIAWHACPMFRQHPQKIHCGRQLSCCRATQVIGNPPAIFVIRCTPRQGQRIAKVSLRTAGHGGALVPAIRTFQVAHRLRAVSEDIAEQSLTFRRAGFGRLARPLERRYEVRFNRRIVGEKLTNTSGVTQRAFDRRASQTAYTKHRQQRLRFDAAVRSRTLEPPRSFRATARHPRAFEIAPRDAILSVGDASLCRPREQRKSFPESLLFDQSYCPAERSRRRSTADQLINDHMSPSLERIPFGSNRNALSLLAFAHVLIGKPAPTFPGHALDRRRPHGSRIAS